MEKGAVLVTGSSSGIGLETALCLAGRGYSVYATMRDLARRDELIQEAAGRNLRLEVLRLDTRDPNSIQECIREIVSRSGTLYGLVNNAGTIVRGYFEDVSEQEMRGLFETNVFGTMAVTRAVLPLMRAARRGRIVIMSSTGGRLGSPGNSAYCSSKFALEGFGECLLQELAPFGVGVSLVEPGFVRTELFGRNRNTASQAMDPEGVYYKWFLKLEELTDKQVRSAVISPRDVAQVVLRILESGNPRLRYVVGARARFLLSLRRHLPGEIFDRIWVREMTRRVAAPKVTC